MARTPTVTRDQVPEKYREAFDHEVAISRHAMENGPGSVMINSPEMRKRANHLVFYFREESELPQNIQELAMILTARAKDCQYIWFAHAARARKEGISHEDCVKHLGMPESFGQRFSDMVVERLRVAFGMEEDNEEEEN